jgi:hypothetical protein
MKNTESESPDQYIINPAYVPAIETVRQYLRSTVGDRNGLSLFDGDIHECNSDQEIHSVLVTVLVSRFIVDILDNSGSSHDPLCIENLEDREQVIQTLDRVGIARPENFASFFPVAFAYALKNVRHSDLD